MIQSGIDDGAELQALAPTLKWSPTGGAGSQRLDDRAEQVERGGRDSWGRVSSGRACHLGGEPCAGRSRLSTSDDGALLNKFNQFLWDTVGDDQDVVKQEWAGARAPEMLGEELIEADQGRDTAGAFAALPQGAVNIPPARLQNRA